MVGEVVGAGCRARAGVLLVAGTVRVSFKIQTVSVASRHVISGMVAPAMLPAPVGGGATDTADLPSRRGLPLMSVTS